jgi:hypothetical protein
LPAAHELLVVRNGRVRVGYRIDKVLFRNSGADDSHSAIVHIIGERPGSVHLKNVELRSKSRAMIMAILSASAYE